MFTESDLLYLAKRGTSVEQAEEQLASIEHGFPFLKLEGAAAVGKGIVKADGTQKDEAVLAWKEYLAAGHRVVKFVPASGAASRMFKNLYAFLDAPYDEPQTDFEHIFFHHITCFAFFGSLDATCVRLYGKGVNDLLAERRYKDVVRALLDGEGMNYGKLPKGLLEFHNSLDGTPRTPLEEHLVEGALYIPSRRSRRHP